VGVNCPHGEEHFEKYIRKTLFDIYRTTTILCDTETVINTRPLNYFSEDPEDLMP